MTFNALRIKINGIFYRHLRANITCHASKHYKIDHIVPFAKLAEVPKTPVTPRGYQRVFHKISQYSFTFRLKQKLLSIFSPEDFSMDTSVKLPDKLRGMKELKREDFTLSVKIPSVVIPVTAIKAFSKQQKEVTLFKKPGVKPIVELDDNDPCKKTHRRLLLHPSHYTVVEALPEKTLHYLSSSGVNIKTWNTLDLDLKYKNWSYQEVLDAVLPESSEGVAGFSQIGHIVHLNLKEELLDYKVIIGQVLLDKVNQAKTIVNKMNTIDNEYRNFQMELIAGDLNYITQVKENGFRFEFDFSKVYWNSRLGTEHQRVVELLTEGDIVLDMFAGVGPFSVPAAKKKCIVHANDLNPESFKWLEHNAKLNKVGDTLTSYNKDGREFARDVVKPVLLKYWNVNNVDKKTSIHIIMNLPALAVEFLDVFSGLLSDEDQVGENFVAPTVHCYSFSKCDNPEQDVRLKAEHYLSCDLPLSTTRFVRSVAPNKDMICISVSLDRSILFKIPDIKEPPTKKMKEGNGEK